MFCSNCWKKLPEDITFCPYCGKKIKDVENANSKDEHRNMINISFELPERYKSIRSFKLPFDMVVSVFILITVIMDVSDYHFYNIVKGLIFIYLAYSAYFWLKFHKNIYIGISSIILAAFFNPFTRFLGSRYERSDLMGVEFVFAIILLIVSGGMYAWKVSKEVEEQKRNALQSFFVDIYFWVAIIILAILGLFILVLISSSLR